LKARREKGRPEKISISKKHMVFWGDYTIRKNKILAADAKDKYVNREE